jgi:23S rRNA (adenine2030-N6)-methyltransferase
MALLYCLGRLTRKDTPFAVLDTHAGRGLYDLRSDEARRSPEWREGVGKLWDWPEAPALAADYVGAVRGFAAGPEPTLYPGSPSLIAAALRDDDVLMACELHPEENAALCAQFGRRANVQIHRRDGWEAMAALLPPPQRRGLVLIDPPYEARDEMHMTVAALKPALKRFSHGIYLWWRPLKHARALAMADAELGCAQLRADLWIDDPAKAAKLVGSSLLILNPPFGLEAALSEALPALAERLGTAEAGWSLRHISN